MGATIFADSKEPAPNLPPRNTVHLREKANIFSYPIEEQPLSLRSAIILVALLLPTVWFNQVLGGADFSGLLARTFPIPALRVGWGPQ